MLWSPRHRFPETALQVICKDQFENFEKLKDANPSLSFPDLAERLLPFTNVHKQFIGDRYSDIKKNRGIFRSQKFNKIPLFKRDFFWAPIPADADYVTQGITRQRLEFRTEEKV